MTVSAKPKQSRGVVMAGRVSRWAALLCGLLGFVGVASAQETKANKTILWLLNDFPPFILVDKELPGLGFVDAAVKYFVKHMPDFEHRFEVAGVARLQGLMAQGAPVCHPALLRTPEREKLAYFSNPVHFALTHHVLIQRKNLARLREHIGSDGKVDVQALLSDSKLSTSLTEGRALGTEIDAALARHQGQAHLKTTGVHFDAPFRHLAAGWTDYVFAYPVEPGYYNMQGRITAPLDLVYLPIAGTKDYTVGHVVCTKSAWGREVIARINTVLAQAGPRPPWVDTQLSYMDTASISRFEQLLARHSPFHSTTKP